MQVNDLLYEASKKDLRKLSWQIAFAFERNYISSITFFTIGSSLIEGPDSLPGTSNVIQEWDKYDYVDFTDRLVSVDDITIEEDMPYSVMSATCDITLNNYDGLFDPDGSSALAPYMLPYRPLRLWLGFDGTVVPVFVGLTDKMPVINEDEKTVSFHCVDFLSLVYDKSMDDLPVQTNKRTDQVLDAMLQLAGLSSTQYDLDVGQNTMDVFYAEKGSTFIQNARSLMEAEQGKIYMDEQGRIKFVSRKNLNQNVVHAFDKHRDIVDLVKRRDDDIINTVTVKTNVRTLGSLQVVWQLAEPVIVPANGTYTLRADLENPCSAINDPVQDVTGDSGFVINTDSDGSGVSSTAVSLTSTDLYSSSFEMVFTNSSSLSLYLYNVILYGYPYLVTDQIYVKEEDAASVLKYGERILEIENDNFESEAAARSKALILIDDYNEYGAAMEVEVKGSPQYQLGDLISVNVDGRLSTGIITRNIMSMSREEGFKQTFTLKENTRRSYFTVGLSLIGGTDYISF